LAFYGGHAEDVLLVQADRLELFTRASGALSPVEPVDGWLLGHHVAANPDPDGDLALALPDRTTVQRVTWP